MENPPAEAVEGDGFQVEVVYAQPRNQTLLTVQVPPGGTVMDAIRLSGILRRHEDIDLHTNKLGVFGRLAQADQALRPGDRVEIYRPLIADPKEGRKQRARDTS